MDIMLKR